MRQRPNPHIPSRSRCSRSLWAVGFIFVFVVIGISMTVIFIGQDLISAEQETQRNIHETANLRHSVNAAQLIDRLRHFQGGGSEGDGSSEESERAGDEEEIESTKHNEEETERMAVNGKEVNINKAEFNKVWKEVESELDEQNKRTPPVGGEGQNHDDRRQKSRDNNLEDRHSDDLTDGDVSDDDDDLDDDDVDSHHDDKHDLDAVLKDAVHSTGDHDHGDHGEDEESPGMAVHVEDDHNADDRSEAAKEENSSDHAENEKELEHEDKASSPGLDSQDLSRLFYPEYYALPTFFDIDGDDVEAMVRYWKEPGVLAPKSLSTKWRFLQKDDLKETIFEQDEHHNARLTDFFNLNHPRSHILNTDFEYLYPFTIPLESYPQHLLTPQHFKYNLTAFLSHDAGGFKSQSLPKYDINEIFAAHNVRHKVIISKQQMYAKHEQYLRDHLGEVELIFPENDTLFFAMMERFGQRLKATIEREAADKNDTNTGGRFLRALKKVEDSKDSRRILRRRRRRRRLRDLNARRLRDGFGLFDSDRDDDGDGDGEHKTARHRVDLDKIDKSTLRDSVRSKAAPPRVHNFNGMTSDITYLHRNRSTPQYLHNPALDDPRGMFMAGNMNYDGAMEQNDRVLVKNERFWRLHDHCVRRKSSTVFPNWRILYKTKPLTCEVILDRLIEPIARCLEEHGLDCPAMIDHGYFRFVFKAEAPAKYLYANASDPEQVLPVVVKVMKTQFVDWSQDWMRHIREAIFLQQLGLWEQDFMRQFGPQFVSEGRERAFYFVPELGHCLYPTYITVTPFYGGNLKRYHRNGQTMNWTLQTATEKALEMVHGLQIMHNIEGGPYSHTDLQPRQFMIDREGNVLINDFNRGKFTEYYFKNAVEGEAANTKADLIIPCSYCMPGSHGHYRAPEEYYSDPLNEKLDIWSLCLTIWSIFSGEKPWSSFGNNYAAVKYVTRDYHMRPKFPYNMPPYLKDVFRQCWRQNMWERPDINELMRKMRYFYKHLHRLSDGREHLTLKELYSEKAYKETNYPDLDKIKQYISRSVSDSN